jgi:hypothetical protein
MPQLFGRIVTNLSSLRRLGEFAAKQLPVPSAPPKWHRTQNPRLNMKSSTLDLRGEKNGASISF